MSKLRLSRRLKKEIPKQFWHHIKLQFLFKKINNKLRLHQFESAMKEVGLAAQKTAKAFDKLSEVSM